MSEQRQARKTRINAPILLIPGQSSFCRPSLNTRKLYEEFLPTFM
jgi:hypothetical protein